MKRLILIGTLTLASVSSAPAMAERTIVRTGENGGESVVVRNCIDMGTALMCTRHATTTGPEGRTRTSNRHWTGNAEGANSTTVIEGAYGGSRVADRVWNGYRNGGTASTAVRRPNGIERTSNRSWTTR